MSDSSQTIQDNEVTKIDWRCLSLTLGFFAIAVVSRDVLHSIEGYKVLIQGLPQTLRWLENPVLEISICLAGLYAIHRTGFPQLIREFGLGQSPLKPSCSAQSHAFQ
jgi:hypothetical protein